MASPVERPVVVTSEFPFDRVTYVALRKRRALAASRVAFRGAVVEPLDGGAPELEQISRWLATESIYLPLGFARSVPARCLRRSEVPDGSGGMEAVEFLVVRSASHPDAVGLSIVYEARRPGDRVQEIDFALGDRACARRVALIRATKLCLLTYLFAVCGATVVRWIRRKRMDGVAGAPSAGASAPRFRDHGETYVVTLERFVSMLGRLERGADPGRMPTVGPLTAKTNS